MSEFTEIASFATETEAGQFRSILEDRGVPAFIDGATANTMLSYVGTALGGVKLFVKTADIERATEAMSELNQEQATADGVWYCGKCEVEVDQGFQVCWSCSQPRAEVEQPAPKITEPALVASELTDDLEPESEASLRRAWRASIIGLVFFPVLTHLYSMFLLIKVSLQGTKISARGQRLFYMTLAVNVFAVCVWGSMLRSMFR